MYEAMQCNMRSPRGIKNSNNTCRIKPDFELQLLWDFPLTGNQGRQKGLGSANQCASAGAMVRRAQCGGPMYQNTTGD